MCMWTENTTQLIDYGASSEAYPKNIKIFKAPIIYNAKVKFDLSIFTHYLARHTH